MNTMSTGSLIVAFVLIALGLAIVAWLVAQRQRSLRLKRRFGPEYDVAVSEFHSRTKAEAELLKREQRVAAFTIVPLSSADMARFSQAWNALQIRFIDNPKGVVGEADLLVRGLMARRGYPMGNFEHCAADISVDHPRVVSNYRAAQSIAARDADGEADTEELRRAVIHYRTLFEELLGAAPDEVTIRPASRDVAVHS
jgi:hypothetical protein